MAKYRIRKLDKKNIIIEELLGEKTPMWVIRAYVGNPAELVTFLTLLAIDTPPGGVDIDRETLANFAANITAAAEKISGAIRNCKEFEI